MRQKQKEKAPERARIVFWPNGGGLSQSAKVIADCLEAAQWQVLLRHDHKWLTFTDNGMLQGAHRKLRRISHTIQSLARRIHYRLIPSKRACVNIFLEDIAPAQLPSARFNIWIPNQEFPPQSWERKIDQIDGIWVKTRYAESIFKERYSHVTFVGFSSFDFYDPRISKRPHSFVHIAGRSRMKGTDLLVQAWERNPHWPTLTIVQSPLRRQIINAANINYQAKKLPAAQLRRLQNESEFHIYPSLAEGFGHVLCESMGMGGVVITTDAPPMNELVSRERGLLMAYDKITTQGLGKNFHCSLQSLEATVEKALSMNTAEKARLSRNARTFFLENQSRFHARLRRAVTDLHHPQAGE